MKKSNLLFSLFLSLSFLKAVNSYGQCAAGYNNASNNWDNLDYLVSAGYYAPNINWPGVPAALASNQAFAIGKTRFTIAYAGGIACTLGENTTNTAEAGSLGAGADVQYANNGTITITFDTLVKNVRFSLYDIDLAQIATVTASDGVAPVNVTMNVVTAGIIGVVGSPGLAPVATAGAGAAANNNTQGTLNIIIPGSAAGVRSIVITIAGTAGDFWLSDISACVYGSFATSYFYDAKPFTGQKTYILATPDSTTVHYIDSATAQAKYLFTGNLGSDPNAPAFVNGISYDHRNHYLYYVHDFGTRSYNTRTLRMWDYNTEAISSLNVDVNTLGIPTFDMGVESAGAAFYDGDLYFGIEGQNRNWAGVNDSTHNSNRESIIWRIEFDASNNPVKSCQVFAAPADNGGGSLVMDWNDFIINDGILYNFNGAAAGPRYQHYNLQTGNLDQNYAVGSAVQRPRQSAITWSGQVMGVYDSITTYNYNGTVVIPKKKILGTTLANMAPDWAKGIGPGGLNIGASGDAAGPFKPKTDFGDAPATYDPSTGDPATHEMDSTIKIGSAEDREFLKKGVTGTEDTDDGISFVSIFDPGTQTYLVQVQVYNHSGSNATLIAWFDYNGDGIFSSGEAITPITISSSTATQSRWLWWPGIISPLANGSSTYLRVRLTTGSLTTSTPTGFFANGEVEDYEVQVDDFPLSVQLFSFDARAVDNNKVVLNWTATEQDAPVMYEIQRSSNASEWAHITYIQGVSRAGDQSYNYTDLNPLKGVSYYRLRFADGKYSSIKTVRITDFASDVTVAPNPVQSVALLKIESAGPTTADVSLINASGGRVFQQKYEIISGTNRFNLPFGNLPSGTYVLYIRNREGDIVTRKIVIKK